ncbi:hypothetical protein L1887_32533 [Cichorium endivia]|nr:hypothetical protein L1887_32533 [Cichorium endivia]
MSERSRNLNLKQRRRPYLPNLRPPATLHMPQNGHLLTNEVIRCTNFEETPTNSSSSSSAIHNLATPIGSK